MVLLSTLRPLALRLWDSFCWFLSGFVTTRSQANLHSLNDDCLLILLGTFSVPQLLTMRDVSRRLSYLIDRYMLPKYSTLIYGYDKATMEKEQIPGPKAHSGIVEAYFSKQQHTYSQFCKRTGFRPNKHERILPTSQLVPLKLCSLPLSLPRLLPNLSCLTLTYFLADQKEELTQEQLTVNRLAAAFLDSQWSQTLQSLHLYIEVPSKPHLKDSFFSKLNQLSTLKHLFLEFSQFPERSELMIRNPFCLPDSMAVLGNLLSFSLHYYEGRNIPTLWAQLGPELSFLSLFNVNCLSYEYTLFLLAHPTYRQTLKTLEVQFQYDISWQIFIGSVQCLPSLERFLFRAHFSHEHDLIPFFVDLARMPQLREVFLLFMSIGQLRAVHRQHLLPGTVPRLTSIRKVAIYIYKEENDDPLQPGELFDNLLPILGRVLCDIENLRLVISLGGSPSDAPLSERLTNRARELFPRLRHCNADYFA